MDQINAEEKAYLYWLHNVPEIGSGTIKRLLEKYNGAQTVYYTPDKELNMDLTKDKVELLREFSRSWNVLERYRQMKDKGIDLVTVKEGNYPIRLSQIKNAPYILYHIGELPEEMKPSAAIIGARECSAYGKYTAEEFAGKLAGRGVNIISGMARGIDGVGQAAAVSAQGKTYAVLGSGVDICYPSANRKLYDAIKETGAILSSFPPGTEPAKRHFPERNRIVAGLSDIVLVVEARQRSGTLITVDMALEQGKNVYAVPGRITDRLSDGCNLLIRQGAGIALSPEDLLAEFKLLQNRKEFCKTKQEEVTTKEKDRNADKGTDENLNINISISTEEEQVLALLDFYPKSVDEIYQVLRTEELKITLPQLMFHLIRLCMAGKAISVQGSFYARTGNHSLNFLQS